jgi:hypothetical protein
MKLLIFIASSTKIQMIIINGLCGINVQKLPRKTAQLRGMMIFNFCRTVKELWFRITTTQITDLLPWIIPGAQEVSRAPANKSF